MSSMPGDVAMVLRRFLRGVCCRAVSRATVYARSLSHGPQSLEEACTGTVRKVMMRINSVSKICFVLRIHQIKHFNHEAHEGKA
jgi:hypothetical protein